MLLVLIYRLFCLWCLATGISDWLGSVMGSGYGLGMGLGNGFDNESTAFMPCINEHFSPSYISNESLPFSHSLFTQVCFT
jgi:hypothetical protein